MYKTIEVSYSSQLGNLAQCTESTANEMFFKGYQLVAMSVTSTQKAYMTFKKRMSEAEIM